MGTEDSLKEMKACRDMNGAMTCRVLGRGGKIEKAVVNASPFTPPRREANSQPKDEDFKNLFC